MSNPESQEMQVDCIRMSVPFTPCLRRSDIMILDVESDSNGDITILGYYNLGDSEINQIVFPTPADPTVIAESDFFRKTFIIPDRKIAVYNTGYESKLFNIPPSKMIELMPLAYYKKEDFIKIASLGMNSSIHLPDWKPRNFHIHARHNYGCIVKAVLILMGLSTYATLDFSENYKISFQNLMRSMIRQTDQSNQIYSPNSNNYGGIPST